MEKTVEHLQKCSNIVCEYGPYCVPKLQSFYTFWTNYEMFPFACFLRFRFIMYLVLALLEVALVNFTLNEYMIYDEIS